MNAVTTNNQTMILTLITPDMARQYRENSIGNRRTTHITVNQYLDEMKRGNWRAMKSAPIVISDDGRLMNGHHRLEAVEKLGRAVPFYVLFGEAPENMQFIDKGKPRTRADNLFIVTGNPDCRVKEAVSKVLLGTFSASGGKRYSAAILDEVEHGFEPGFGALLGLEKARSKLPAPYLAAFVFCFDLYPSEVITLAKQVICRDAAMGTPACAILRLMQDGENTSKTGARLKTFTAVVGGIEKFVKGEKADFLRVNNAAADRINEMRKTRGFYYFTR